MRIYLFIGTIDLLLSIIAYTYLRLHFHFVRNWSFTVIFLILMVNMIGCRLLPEGTPLIIAKLSAWLSGLWIALMFYILIASIGHGFLHIADKLANLHLPHQKIATTIMAFIICFITWGTFRAMNPIVRTEHLNTEKLSSQTNYKIIFLTDIHLGQILGRSYADRLVNRINQQNADLVLISGDLLDEKIRYLERENTLEALAHIKSKYGTYMAFGNHDYLDRPMLWEKMLKEQGITPLRNKDIIINDNLKITGINDWSREKSTDALIQLSKTNNNYYSILMDHQPRRIDAAAAAGYDLYLAGHTHTGQLFPNRQVTKRMYKLDYGRALFDKMTAITNNGYGFWGPPVRTEFAPEMVVLSITGK